MGIITFFKYLFTSNVEIVTPNIPIVDSQIKLNNLKITTMDLTGQFLAAGTSKTLTVSGMDEAGVDAPITDPSFSVSKGNATLSVGSNPRSQVITSPDGSLFSVSVSAFPINADGSVDSTITLSATLTVNDNIVTVPLKATKLILSFQ